MLEVIMSIANSVGGEIIQLVAGYIVSAAVYLVLRKSKSYSFNSIQELLVILIMTIIGMVLPISGFGIVPIIAVLVGCGFPPYTVLPMLFSNFLFNMLVPYGDVTFTWHNGFLLIVLAFAAGVASSIILKILIKKDRTVVNWNAINGVSLSSSGPVESIKGFINSANIILPYLLVGAAVNTLFSNFAFMRIMGWVNTGPIGTVIPVIFEGYDITTPVFLLAMSILSVLMNLRNLAVLAVVFKTRGILLYYVYFFVWIMLLSAINLFTR